jgi:hypothetical protein
MPGAQISRRGRGWIAVAAVAALVVLAFVAPRIAEAIGRLVAPPPSNIIIVAPEGSETV